VKSLGNFPDPFIAEIAGQPDALRRAAAGLLQQTTALQQVAARAQGRTLVFTGMGSSHFACYPAVTELAASGIAAVMIDAAELLHFRTGILGARTMLVAVSQSGESAEIVRLLRELPDSRSTIVAVTNGSQNTLASLSDVALDTFTGEETGPSTMTFAGSLLALGTLARVLAGEPVAHAEANSVRNAELAASAIERLLGDSALPDALVAWLGNRTTAVILGRGPARAAAEMGALTIKEAVGIPVESLQTAQFRHGPLELAGPDLAAMIIATEPETSSLDLSLAEELRTAGAAVLVVTRESHGFAGATSVEIGALERTIAPAVSILPSQLLAWRLAGMRGREPGSYYRASKVTTRE
jgi:glutamine---fructose-6-phosphate transaminase (isomerizing)